MSVDNNFNELHNELLDLAVSYGLMPSLRVKGDIEGALFGMDRGAEQQENYYRQPLFRNDEALPEKVLPLVSLFNSFLRDQCRMETPVTFLRSRGYDDPDGPDFNNPDLPATAVSLGSLKSRCFIKLSRKMYKEVKLGFTNKHKFIIAHEVNHLKENHCIEGHVQQVKSSALAGLRSMIQLKNEFTMQEGVVPKWKQNQSLEEDYFKASRIFSGMEGERLEEESDDFAARISRKIALGGIESLKEWVSNARSQKEEVNREKFMVRLTLVQEIVSQY